MPSATTFLAYCILMGQLANTHQQNDEPRRQLCFYLFNTHLLACVVHVETLLIYRYVTDLHVTQVDTFMFVVSCRTVNNVELFTRGGGVTGVHGVLTMRLFPLFITR